MLSAIGTIMAQQWVLDVAEFLPDAADGQSHAYSYSDAPASGLTLNGWGGFAVLAAEVVAVGALALTVARRRDV